MKKKTIKKIIKKIDKLFDNGAMNFYIGMVLALVTLFSFDGFDLIFFMNISIILLNWYYAFTAKKETSGEIKYEI